MDNILVFVVVAVLIAIIVKAGVTLIDGQRVDVVTNGEFIEPETEVEVVVEEGSRLVVRSR